MHAIDSIHKGEVRPSITIIELVLLVTYQTKHMMHFCKISFFNQHRANVILSVLVLIAPVSEYFLFIFIICNG